MVNKLRTVSVTLKFCLIFILLPLNLWQLNCLIRNVLGGDHFCSFGLKLCAQDSVYFSALVLSDASGAGVTDIGVCISYIVIILLYRNNIVIFLVK